ncbi:hypothetical protein VTK73DRAFT_6627 [Phialemonium thermophilum]|uniref:Uncharacterized protein n=1 Tax=Phialemonium thermophilum TaxID=223376 RepID=A0ABR3XV99_9PEZI
MIYLTSKSSTSGIKKSGIWSVNIRCPVTHAFSVSFLSLSPGYNANDPAQYRVATHNHVRFQPWWPSLWLVRPSEQLNEKDAGL